MTFIQKGRGGFYIAECKRVNGKPTTKIIRPATKEEISNWQKSKKKKDTVIDTMEEIEEYKDGEEIPTPPGIRFYPCENCIFNGAENYYDIDLDEIKDQLKTIGSLAAREGLERRLRELHDEIFKIQDELKYLDRRGFHETKKDRPNA